MTPQQSRANALPWTKQIFKNKLLLILLALIVVVIGIIITISIQNNNRQTASAATCTWSGANSGDFSDPGNWSSCPTGSGVPEEFDELYFPDIATTYSLNNDLGLSTYGAFIVEPLTNSDYILSGGDISNWQSLDTQTGGSFTFIFQSNAIFCGLNGGGNISVDSGYTLTTGCGNNSNYTFSGNISGNGTLAKANNGIQTLDNTNATISTINVADYFLQFTGNTTVTGQLNNTNGDVLFNGLTSVSNNPFVQTGGGINTGPGFTTTLNSYNFNSGNFGVDASNGSSGQVVVENGTTDLSNGTFSMRFFDTYTVGQTFNVLTTNNSGILTGEFSNFPSGNNIVAEGWGSSSVINDVYISVVYSSTDTIITIEEIIPKACSGNKTLTTETGTFDSGTVDYFANSTCNWVISPVNADSVTLDFTAFNTEDVNDVVSVYDGLTISSPLLGTFSGNSLPSSLTADSGIMLITFTSNATVEASGFAANWTSTLLPLPTISTVVPDSGTTAGGTNVTLTGSNFLSGQYQNIESIGSTGYDGIRGMVVDASGQYVTGEFTGSITLGSTTLNSTGDQDIYIAKIDSNGDYVWAVSAGGTGNDGYNRRQSMHLNDDDGTLLIAGYYQNSADFGATNLNGGTGANIFISKIDKSNGDFIWAVSAGGSTAQLFDVVGSSFPIQYGGSMDVDSSGNIYLAGKVTGTSPTFGAIGITLENPIGDLYVAKLDSSGSFLWVKNYGQTEANENGHLHGLVVDSSDNVYATGGYAGSITIGATTLTSTGASAVGNIAIFKLDSSGSEIWAVSGGTVGALVGANDLPYDLDLDSSQNLYMTGYFGGTSATYGSINLVGSATGSTVVTTQLDPSNGSFVWASRLTTPAFGTSRDMFIDSSDKIWIGGTYSDTISDGNLTVTGTGANAFFAQYNTSGTLEQLNGIGGTGGQLLVGGVGGNQVRAVYEYNGKFYIAGEYFDTIGIGGQTIVSSGNQDGFYTTWVSDKVSVKIDGTEVVADFISSTELTFVTPAKTAGLKDVVVTNYSGNAYVLNNGYEYIGPDITNGDISSMNCTPTSTAVNTTVNCVITTNVNLNTLSGSVNVRIDTSGTIINCPVTGSGTTLNCNNIPVGSVEGVFASQYNASGSGTTYINGNNITVTAAAVCGGGASGTGSNGNTAITDILLCVGGGNLILTSPSSTNFTSITVGTAEQNTNASLEGVVVEDLRGSEAGWSLVCKSTNLAGVLDNNWIIPVYKDSASKFNITPTGLQVVGSYGNVQNGLTDYTSLQNTTSVTDETSTGESNNFNLASFTSGYGIGKYTKNLSLGLTIPPYIRAQAYVGTLICSVS